MFTITCDTYVYLRIKYERVLVGRSARTMRFGTRVWRVRERMYERYLVGIHSKQNNRTHPLRIYTYLHRCMYVGTRAFCKLTSFITTLFLSILINNFVTEIQT